MIRGAMVKAAKRPARILVVDDEEAVRTALQKVLEKEHYVVDCARSAAEAMERANASTFDLVITDIVMPGVDGLALVSHLREDNPDIKVIVMSAIAGWGQSADALKAGAYVYLVKSAKKDAIVKVVKDALDRRPRL